MRYLSIGWIDERSAKPPTEQYMEDIGKLIEAMTKEGKLVRIGGLRPTAEGCRVHLRAGKLSTTDGPFIEAKEVIGGYAVLEADSKEEAVELAGRFLLLHGDALDMDCEIRPLDGEEAGAEG